MTFAETRLCVYIFKKDRLSNIHIIYKVYAVTVCNYRHTQNKQSEKNRNKQQDPYRSDTSDFEAELLITDHWVMHATNPCRTVLLF